MKTDGIRALAARDVKASEDYEIAYMPARVLLQDFTGVPAVADLAGNRFGALANRRERFAATFSCRAAIKAGHALTREEMAELVARLMETELPAHDVHGRPTIVQLPLAELERRFGRR